MEGVVNGKYNRIDIEKWNRINKSESHSVSNSLIFNVVPPVLIQVALIFLYFLTKIIFLLIFNLLSG